MRIQKRAKERQEKGEDRRPTLKKVRAVLLRSFGGHPGKKMFCARGVLGVTGVLGKAFRPNPNGVGDHTTTLRRLLVGAEEVTIAPVKSGLCLAFAAEGTKGEKN